MPLVKFSASRHLGEYHSINTDLRDGEIADVNERIAGKLLVDFKTNFKLVDGSGKVLDDQAHKEFIEKYNIGISSPQSDQTMVKLRFLPNNALLEYHSIHADFTYSGDEQYVTYTAAERMIKDFPLIFQPVSAKAPDITSTPEQIPIPIQPPPDKDKAETKTTQPLPNIAFELDKDEPAKVEAKYDLSDEEKVKLILSQHPNGLSLSDISLEMGMKWTSVRPVIVRLSTKGEIVQDDKVYKLATPDNKTKDE